MTLADFTIAIERIVAGIEKKHGLLGEDEKRLVAYHELGHALTALALPSTDRVQKVSIVPHGIGALGYTLQRPSEDRHLQRRTELIDRLTVLLGGRAAEELVFGEPSTGAADDLARATGMARDMVLRFGMDEGLGPVAYADAPASPLVGLPAMSTLSERASPATAERIDAAVQALLGHARQRATEILRDNREMLDRTAAALMAQETLDEEALLALTAGLRAAGRPAAIRQVA
ncbi:ATP-dependent zinc metalloprotease FtsH 4 [Methylibium sp. T29]|nr:ATP-dependent zinc metalloprotease FtsH 4 [Methylibium sp. T29]